MLPARFDDITADDILRLVSDKIAEHKTLEYKATLALGNTDEKAEFLSDVSSFANASGGDILFGITDEREGSSATGVPGELVGLALTNASAECNRVEQLIRDGIQPRLPVLFVKTIEVPEHGIVLLVRVGKSWIAPHMVSYANRTRFFSRNSSTGKVQLDVQQIGAAFAQQRGIGERLRDWKADRISKAISGNGPVQLAGAQLLFHFVPAATVAADNVQFPRMFDTNKLSSMRLLMCLSPQTSRYNADGLLFVSQRTTDNAQSYLQLFKDGALEYGDSYVFNSYGAAHIASQTFEGKIVKTFARALNLLSMLAVSSPIYVGLTLIEMKGRTMALPFYNINYERQSDPFDRDVILCPDVLISDGPDDEPFSETLLPIVNSVWQAAGMEKSPYINDGRWIVPDPG
jgi:Putative DNA-binding domain